jgi:Fe2+ or Zn2+ uptake regulation protein
MGFRIEPTSLEIKGLCNDCAAPQRAAPAAEA